MDGTPAKALISSLQIKTMMLDAQRQIEERKRMLEALKKNPTKPIIPQTPPMQAAPVLLVENDKPLNITALQEQIRAKLAQNSQIITPPQLQERPIPLILDSQGRTVDESGREINVPQLVPTLKANIRAKKRETTKTHIIEVSHASAAPSKFHDERISSKTAARPRKELRFHEPGKFVIQGERLRMKAQLEKLQNEISQIARKTGISSATKLALIAPKADTTLEEVPAMEWWDSVILADSLNTLDSNGGIVVREQAITNLIEHPTQIRPPNESSRPSFLPVFLTKKEQKKLRRQNRRETWKEEQEKIRLGLIDPPEPKLRISNIMRVLGNEAIQDPTRIEVHVKAQMAKRQKTHEETNNARKLTAEQRREKKIRKIKEDTSMGVHVSVYRIRDLHGNVSKKYKVETNAKQLLMTGIVILFKDCCVVVVEGGPKQQKKYRRLMMNRIKWEEDIVKDLDGHEVPNSCSLVWEGLAPRRNFGEVKFKTIANEKAARELFQKYHVEHYWDLAYSGAVLEATEEM